MAISHIETTISQGGVRVRYANDLDSAKATEWIDVRTLAPNLKMGSGTRVSDPESHSLAGLRVAALLHARDELNAEIQRLAEIVRRNF